jgi:hypothetical protein
MQRKWLSGWLPLDWSSQSRQMGWRREDIGRAVARGQRRSRKARQLGDAPPQRVVEAYCWMSGGQSNHTRDTPRGYRNAVSILNRWGLLTRTQGGNIEVRAPVLQDGGAESVIRHHAASEEGLRLAVERVRDCPSITGDELGDMIAGALSQNWKSASKRRVGNALYRWTEWLLEGERAEKPSSARGRRRRKKYPVGNQGSLF